MLIAEIHGKRFPDIEGREDFLTSAVFGHLRNIPPSLFWPQLLLRALNSSKRSVSLHSQLGEAGIDLRQYSNLSVSFWRYFKGYGEPDLVIRFSGGNQRLLVLIVEVKLDSGKSGRGEDDQLKRYLELLNDRSAFATSPQPETTQAYLVYLTRNFSKMEMEESVEYAIKAGVSDAAEKLFGLQWQDVLDCAAANAHDHDLLREVAEFLKRRGFEAFKGFGVSPGRSKAAEGTFFRAPYFRKLFRDISFREGSEGHFYNRAG